MGSNLPILDHEHQTKGYFTRAGFTFDAAANAFLCPAGKQLTNSGLVREDGTMPYRQYERLPGVRIEGPLHERRKAHRDAQSLRGRTRACTRTKGNARFQTLSAAAQES